MSQSSQNISTGRSTLQGCVLLKGLVFLLLSGNNRSGNWDAHRRKCCQTWWEENILKLFLLLLWGVSIHSEISCYLLSIFTLCQPDQGPWMATCSIASIQEFQIGPFYLQLLNQIPILQHPFLPSSMYRALTSFCLQQR